MSGFDEIERGGVAITVTTLAYDAAEALHKHNPPLLRRVNVQRFRISARAPG